MTQDDLDTETVNKIIQATYSAMRKKDEQNLTKDKTISMIKTFVEQVTQNGTKKD